MIYKHNTLGRIAQKSNKENKYYNIDKQKPSDLSNLTLTIPEEIVHESEERQPYISSWIENLAEELEIKDLEKFRDLVYKYKPISRDSFVDIFMLIFIGFFMGVFVTVLLGH